MNTLPCKDCICFAVCNAKVYRLNIVYKTQFVIRELGNCSLLNKWATDYNEGCYPYSGLYNACEEQLKVLCECFNLKYDVKPDYNLLRHLHHPKTILIPKFKRI